VKKITYAMDQVYATSKFHPHDDCFDARVVSLPNKFGVFFYM
jgi:hypothetical protein